LVVDRKIYKLEREIGIAKTNTQRNIIAQRYAFSKAESEKRTIVFEDLQDGYVLAEEFIEQEP